MLDHNPCQTSHVTQFRLQNQNIMLSATWAGRSVRPPEPAADVRLRPDGASSTVIGLWPDQPGNGKGGATVNAPQGEAEML